MVSVLFSCMGFCMGCGWKGWEVGRVGPLGGGIRIYNKKKGSNDSMNYFK